MIKRTVEISQQPAHLTVRDGQLLILPRGDAIDPSPDCKGEVQEGGGGAQPRQRGVRARLADEAPAAASIPCEDIGVLLVEHPGCTYTHAALTTLLANDAAVVICGRDHLPAGMLLPIGQHTQVVPRIRQQIAMKRPLRKQLWKQVIQGKIRAQAGNFPAGSRTRSRLLALARGVRSGDPSNVEAQAAKSYWAGYREMLADPGFSRDPDGAAPNNLLNYGYAVLRAAVARALVSAGLLPALGIHHHHRANAFALADDLLEPLRALVDERVMELAREGQAALIPPVKAALLELLTAPVRTAGQSGPLMVGLHRYVASLVRCCEGETRRLDIPVAEGRACT